MNPLGPFKRLMRAESMWQLLDQGAVSGGNFLTNLALARTLAPDAYGTFSLLFLSLIGLNTIHASVVVYPLTLTTATVEKHMVRHTVGEASVQTALLVPVQAFILCSTALFVRQFALLPLLVLVSFAWQLQETTRRALLADQRPRTAFFPDAFSYLGQGILVLMLRPSSLTEVLVFMAATSMAASLVQHLCLRTSFATAFSKAHMHRSWKLGKYTLAANALTMVAAQVPGWTLALSFGRGTVAYYQALYNLVGMANPVLFSVSNLLIPAVARNAVRGIQAARSTALRVGMRFSILLVVPAILLLLCPTLCMRLLYGEHSPYLEYAYLLRFFVPMLLLDYGTIVIGAYEGGNGRPQSYMYVQSVATLVLVLLGIPVITMLGIKGAALAVLAVSACRLVAFGILSRRNDARSLKLTLRDFTPAKEAL